LKKCGARTLHAVSAIDDCGVYVRLGMFLRCLLSCKIYGVCALSVKYMVCVCARALSL